MTTTFPGPAAPVSTPVSSAAASAPSLCPVERRALATAARDLAEAVTGIAFDAPCRPARQQAVLEFSAGVLRAVQAGATRTGDVALHRAGRAVDAAMPVFAREVSAGAPALAGAWIAVSDLLPEEDGTGSGHTTEQLLACERRFRSAAGRTSFGVPWFVDACTSRDRVRLVRAAPRGLRLALRLTEDRWLELRDAVRGAPSAP